MAPLHNAQRHQPMAHQINQYLYIAGNLATSSLGNGPFQTRFLQLHPCRSPKIDHSPADSGPSRRSASRRQSQAARTGLWRLAQTPLVANPTTNRLQIESYDALGGTWTLSDLYLRNASPALRPRKSISTMFLYVWTV